MIRFQDTVVIVPMCVVFCGGSGTHPASDSGACVIASSNYDQSCSLDSDCVGMAGEFPVQSGNYCQTMCLCGGDAINRSAVARYVQDVSMTPLGSGPTSAWGNCGCGQVGTPCCVHGSCTTSCPATVVVPDAGPAGDAQGAPPNSIMCSLNGGPLDGGTDAGAPWRWCTPPSSCVPFNGGWACCSTSSSGPTVCSVPGA